METTRRTIWVYIRKYKLDTLLIEFFRTSEYNYKIYALRIVFFEELQTLFR